MTEIRGLSLTQPWASLVALGHKTVETRSWRTQYRGRIAIHAAKNFPPAARAFAAEERTIGRIPARLPIGGIVCLVDLIDVLPAALVALDMHDWHEKPGLERRFGDYSAGRYAWIFNRPRLVTLAEPVAVRGARGLWRIPEDVAAQLAVLDCDFMHPHPEHPCGRRIVSGVTRCAHCGAVDGSPECRCWQPATAEDLAELHREALFGP